MSEILIWGIGRLTPEVNRAIAGRKPAMEVPGTMLATKAS